MTSEMQVSGGDKPMQVATSTPAELLRVAIQSGAGLEMVKQVMELQERWEANEARKQFNVAFATFKAKSIKIIRRTVTKDGPLKNKKYANLFDVVDTITEPLAELGLSLSWALTKDDKDWMEVTCTIRHAMGHSESVSMGAAPDTGPGRNAIQARGSAKSYLERYTALAILGMATTDSDDDGAGTSTDTSTLISRDQEATIVALMEEVGQDEGKFLRMIKLDRLDNLPACNYKMVIDLLEAKRSANKARS